jgi:hypothetical protein
VSEQIASVESTESTVKIGAPIPLDQVVRDIKRRADWTLSRYERNLCFFLGDPKVSERQSADP